MPRSKTGKKRVPIDAANIKAAVEAVTKHGDGRISLREACNIYNIKITTLHRHVKGFRASEKENYIYDVHYDIKKVFTDAEEQALVQYIKTIARMQYGLTKKNVRELAYKFALHNKKKYPQKWNDVEMAGEEWMRLFLKRHSDLSLRKPEPTSLSRSTSFNRTNVNNFFNNLKNVHARLGPFPPERIYNTDETGLKTVQQPKKILAPTGEKQVGSVTSAERGTLVTMITAINALGNQIPPMLIFPRVHYKDFMLRGAPAGSIGKASSSGWSNEIIFAQYLKHFIHHAKPTKEDPLLLILDNHGSHNTLEAIDLCRENGIVLLTFPPHTSHKLQPLDLTVFGPLKAYYNEDVDIWHRNNPGKTFNIYNVAEIAGQVYPRALSASNIISGFKAAGIYPLNPNIFPDDAFLVSYVTDRPLEISSPTILQPDIGSPQEQPSTSSSALDVSTILPNITEIESPSTPVKQTNNTISDLHKFISPEEIAPFPKAAPRKTTNRGRKPGKTRILTDTPEREEILLEKKKKMLKTKIETKQKARQVARKVMESDSEDDEDILSKLSDEHEETLSDLENEMAEIEDERRFEAEDLQAGDFVLVQFLKKKGPAQHFVGEICAIKDIDLQIKFLKRVDQTNKFWYDNHTVYDVAKPDVILKLPLPKKSGGSKRLRDQLVFEVNFTNSKYNVK